MCVCVCVSAARVLFVVVCVCVCVIRMRKEDKVGGGSLEKNRELERLLLLRENGKIHVHFVCLFVCFLKNRE